MLLIILQIVVVVLFMYLFWRGLRENYHDYKLIEFSWVVLLGFLMGGRLLFVLGWGWPWNASVGNWFWLSEYPGFNIMGGYLTVLFLSVIFSRKNNWKLWPLLEDMTLILVPFLVIVELFRLRVGYEALALFLTWLALGLVKNRYRSFVWFKSGKKGFLWFFGNMFGFGLLSLGAVLSGNYWLMALVYGFLGLISGVGLFMLGKS